MCHPLALQIGAAEREEMEEMRREKLRFAVMRMENSKINQDVHLCVLTLAVCPKHRERDFK